MALIVALLVAVESASIYSADEELIDCDNTKCEVFDQHLYPHRNMSLYYMCVPESESKWIPMERPCPPSLKFDVEQQACTLDGLDVCMDEPIPEPTEDPEPEPTDPEPEVAP